MLTLYGRKSAFNVQKVRWFLAELDLDYQHIEKGGSFGGLDDPEFRALNPHGRVPLLSDGNAHIWESHTILRYLAARYSPTRFWREDPVRRAEVDQWLDWSLSRLQIDFLTGVFWGYYRTPEAERDVDEVNAKIAACARHMRLLDQQIGDKPFLLGDDLTLADITIGTNLYRYFNIDIDRPDVPNVARWYRSLTERQGYQECVMMPFDHMYGRLAF